MNKLSNTQRIKRIDELLAQIEPLKTEEIFLNTSIFFSGQMVFSSGAKDEGKVKEAIEEEKKLNKVRAKLTPLLSELRSLQILYRVQYEGEVINSQGITTMEPQSEYLLLKTEYDIDTTLYGWETYLQDETARELFSEILKFLIDARFSKVLIQEIKRM